MKRNTKSALLFSVVSIIICCTMLLGTTMAWFTDSVTSARNQIIAGNLDVELYRDTIADDNKIGGSTKLFDEVKLWEPGAVLVENLVVSNEGNLALKYQLTLDVLNETDFNGKKLSDVIKVALVEGGFTGDRAAAQALTNYVDFADFVKEGKLDITKNVKNETVGIVLYWAPSDNDNDYNMNNENQEKELKLELGVVLVATQLEAESDSFDNTYDEDAEYFDASYTVTTSEEFENALNEAAAFDGPVLITLAANVEWETGAGRGSTPLIPEGATVDEVVIDGQGTYKLTATGAGVGPIRSANGGTLKFRDIEIVDASESYAEGSWEFGYLEFAGNLVFDNVTFKKAIAIDGESAVFNNCYFNSNADSEYAVWVSNGKATFTNCIFEGTRGLKTHETYGSEVDTIVVDNCSFGPLSKKPGMAIGTVNADTTIVIKNSAFANVQAGDQGLFIYETDTDVTTFNFTCENNVLSTFVEVTSADELATKLSSAGSAGAGNTVIRIDSDLDLTSTDWTPIKVDGYHGADIVTIDGQGHTITGLSAPLFAGGFAGGSGIVIKNLTIADSNIVSTNTIGSGAFIESADSMTKIALINCHLKNSKVTGGSGSRTGGLLGWTAGYSKVNDGPVKTYVTIEDCSVVGCTITCDGSVGGIYGHAGNNDWTYSTVKNCVVKNNTLNSTDDGGWRVGVVVGTANVGEVTIENITEFGNTLTQTGKTAPAGQSNLYGRFVPGTTGKLTIDGVAIN